MNRRSIRRPQKNRKKKQNTLFDDDGGGGSVLVLRNGLFPYSSIIQYNTKHIM